ncbi:conserved hypothetical protein (plasmid) [Rhodococcus jostii RHA1]|uniref:Uncharacterized protein n=1 Tax=Rhodococcus jostii (strain RHA1) TaxID=101510 RepID=Q0S049_RHOJR|nr:conserved hypothetical protein [Rhodococcus jostii RHA1]
MLTGADSIDDVDHPRRRHPDSLRVGVRPSTPKDLPARVHLRAHPAARGGAATTPDRPRTPLLPGIEDRAFLDIDSLLRPVYG